MSWRRFDAIPAENVRLEDVEASSVPGDRVAEDLRVSGVRVGGSVYAGNATLNRQVVDPRGFWKGLRDGIKGQKGEPGLADPNRAVPVSVRNVDPGSMEPGSAVFVKEYGDLAYFDGDGFKYAGGNPEIFASASFAPISGRATIGKTLRLEIRAPHDFYEAERCYVNRNRVTNLWVDVSPSFKNESGGLYSAVYTVKDAHLSWPASELPVSIVLKDKTGARTKEITSVANSPRVDAEIPHLASISFQPSLRCKPGDLMRATMRFSLPLAKSPEVTFFGRRADGTIGEGDSWEAVCAIASKDPEGPMPVSVSGLESLSGNANPEVETLRFVELPVVDKTAPTITSMTSDLTSPTNSDILDIYVDFNKEILDLPPESVSCVRCKVVETQRMTDVGYRVRVLMYEDGPVMVRIVPGGASDYAGNKLIVDDGDFFEIYRDTENPDVYVTKEFVEPASADTLRFTINTWKDCEVARNDAIRLSNLRGVKRFEASGPRAWILEVSTFEDRDLEATIELLDGLFVDSALNPSVALSERFRVDRVNPKADLRCAFDKVNDDFEFAVVGSEPLAGLDPGRLALSNVLVASWIRASSNEFVVKARVVDPGPIEIRAAPGAVSDLAFNKNVETSAPLNLSYRKIPAQIVASFDPTPKARPGYYSSSFRAAFVAAETLRNARIEASGCVLSSIPAIGASFVVVVTPRAPVFEATLKATDSYGNGSAARLGPFRYRNAIPRFSVELEDSEALPDHYSSKVLAYAGSDVELFEIRAIGVGCSTSGLSRVDDRTYSFEVHPSSETFEVSCEAYDLYGNFAAASTGQNFYRRANPNLRFRETSGYYNADAVLEILSDAETFEIEKSLLLSNCELVGVDRGAGLFVTLRPTASVFSCGIAGAIDVYGNRSADVPPKEMRFRGRAPGFEVSLPRSTRKFNGPFVVTARYEDAVTLRAENVRGINAGISGFSGAGASYSFVVAPASFEFGFSLAGCLDLYGNTTSSYESGTLLFDKVAPSLAFRMPKASGYYSGPAKVGLLASDPVVSTLEMVGFGCSISGLERLSATSWSFDVHPNAPVFSFATRNAYDEYENKCADIRSPDLKFNQTPPSAQLVVETTPNALPGKYSSSFLALARFGADVQSVEASNLDARGASIGPISGSGASYSWTIYPHEPEFAVRLFGVRDLYGNPVSERSTETLFYDPVPGTLGLRYDASENGEPGYYNGPFYARALMSKGASNLGVSRVSAVGAKIADFSGSAGSASFRVEPSGPSFSFSVSGLYDVFGNAIAGFDSGKMMFKRSDASYVVEVREGGSGMPGYFNAPFDVSLGFEERVRGLRWRASGASLIVGESGSGVSFVARVTPTSETFEVSAFGARDPYGNAMVDWTSGPMHFDDTDVEVRASDFGDPRASPGHFSSAFVANFEASKRLLDVSYSNVVATGARVGLSWTSGTSFAVAVSPSSPSFSFQISGLRDWYGNVAATLESGPLFFDDTVPRLDVRVRREAKVPGYYNSGLEFDVSTDRVVPRLGFPEHVGAFGCAVDIAATSSRSAFVSVNPDSGVFGFHISGLFDIYGNEVPRFAFGPASFDDVAPSASLRLPTQERAAPGYYRSAFDATFVAEDALQAFGASNVAAYNASVAVAGSGCSYTLRITPSSETFGFSISGLRDLYDNELSEVSSPGLKFSTVRPVASLKLPGVRFNAEFVAQVSFDKIVRGFGASNVSTSECVIGDVVLGPGGYSFRVSPKAHSFRFSIGGVVDLFGNECEVASTGGLFFKAAPPELEFDMPTNVHASPGYYNSFATAALRFEDNVTSLSLRATGASLGPTASSGSTFFVDVFPFDPEFAIEVVDAVDLYGNRVPKSNLGPWSWNPTAPEVRVSVPASRWGVPGFYNSEFEVVVESDRVLANFNADRLSFNGCLAYDVKSSGNRHAFKVRPSSAYFAFAISGVRDLYGNAWPLWNSGVLRFEEDAPSQTFENEPRPHAKPGKYGGPFSVSATFGDDVVDFRIDRIETTNAEASEFAGSGNAFSFVVTPTSDFFSYSVSGLHDRYGNELPAFASPVMRFGTRRPSVTTSISKRRYNAPFQVSLEFDEDVADVAVISRGARIENVTTTNPGTRSFGVKPELGEFSFGVSEAYNEYGNACVPFDSGPLFFRDSLRLVSVTPERSPAALEGYYNSGFRVAFLASSEMESVRPVGRNAEVFLGELRGSSEFEIVVQPSGPEFGYGFRDAYDVFGNALPDYDSPSLRFREKSAGIEVEYPRVRRNALPGHYNAPIIAEISGVQGSYARVVGFGAVATKSRVSGSGFSLALEPSQEIFRFVVENGVDEYGNALETWRSGELRFSASFPGYASSDPTNPNAVAGYFNEAYTARVEFERDVTYFDAESIETNGCEIANFEGSLPGRSFSFEVRPFGEAFSYSAQNIYDAFGNVGGIVSPRFRYQRRERTIDVRPEAIPNALPGYFKGPHLAQASCEAEIYRIALATQGCDASVAFARGSSIELAISPDSASFSYSIEAYDAYGNPAYGRAGPFQFDPTPPRASFELRGNPNALEGYYSSSFEAKLTFDSPVSNLETYGSGCSLEIFARQEAEYSFLLRVQPGDPEFKIGVRNTYDAYGNEVVAETGPLRFREVGPSVSLSASSSSNAKSDHYNGLFTDRVFALSGERLHAPSATGDGCGVETLEASGAILVTVSPHASVFSYVASAYDDYGNVVRESRGPLYHKSKAGSASFSGFAASGLYNAPFDVRLVTADPVHVARFEAEGCDVSFDSSESTVRISPRAPSFALETSGTFDVFGNELSAKAGPFLFSPALRAYVKAQSLEPMFSGSDTLFTMTINNQPTRQLEIADLSTEEGLVSRCGFEETPADDVVGSRWTFKTPARYVDSRVPGNKAIRFERSYAQRYVPYVGNQTAPRSVCAWIYDHNVLDSSGSGYDSIMIAHGNDPGKTDFYLVKVVNRSSYYLRYNMPPTSNFYTLGSKTQAVEGRPGTWQHHCVTFDGKGTLSHYLDGRLASCVSGATFQQTNGGSEVLGAAGGSQFADVAIDDYRVYDICLSEEEIRSMASGNNPFVFDFRQVSDLTYSFRVGGTVSPGYGLALRTKSSAADYYGNVMGSQIWQFVRVAPSSAVMSPETQELAMPGYYRSGFTLRTVVSGFPVGPLGVGDLVASGCSLALVGTSAGSVTLNSEFVVHPSDPEFSIRVSEIADKNGSIISASTGTLRFKVGDTPVEVFAEPQANADTGKYSAGLWVRGISAFDLQEPRFDVVGCAVTHVLVSGPSFAAFVEPSFASFSLALAPDSRDAYGNVAYGSAGPFLYDATDVKYDVFEDSNADALEGYHNGPFDVTIRAPGLNSAGLGVATLGCSASAAVRGDASDYSFRIFPSSPSFSYAVSDTYNVYGKALRYSSRVFSFDDRPCVVNVELDQQEGSVVGYYTSSFVVRIQGDSLTSFSDSSHLKPFGCVFRKVDESGIGNSERWTQTFEVEPLAPVFWFEVVDLFNYYGTAAEIAGYNGTDLHFSEKPTTAYTNFKRQDGAALRHYSSPFYGSVVFVDGMVPGFGLHMVEARGCSLSEMTDVESVFSFRIEPYEHVFGYALKRGVLDYFGREVAADTGELFYLTRPVTMQVLSSRSPDSEDGFYNGPFAVDIRATESLTDIGPESVTVSGASVSSWSGSGASYSFVISPYASTFSFDLKGVYDMYGTPVPDHFSGPLRYKSNVPAIEVSTTRAPFSLPGFYNSAFDARLRSDSVLKAASLANFATSFCGVSGISGSGSELSFRVTPLAASFSFRILGLHDVYGNRAPEHDSGPLRFSNSSPTPEVTETRNPRSSPGYYNGMFAARLKTGEPIFGASDWNVEAFGASVTRFVALEDGLSVSILPFSGSFGYVVSGLYDAYGNAVPTFSSGNLQYSNVAPTIVVENPTNPNADPGFFNSAFVARASASQRLGGIGSFAGTGASCGSMHASGHSLTFLVQPSQSPFSYVLSDLWDVYGNAVRTYSSQQFVYSPERPVLNVSNPTNPFAIPGFFNNAFVARVTSGIALKSLGAPHFFGTNASASNFSGRATSFTFVVAPGAASFSYRLSGILDVCGNLAQEYVTPTLRYKTTAPILSLTNPTNANALPGYFNAPFAARLSADSNLVGLSGGNFSGTSASASWFSGSRTSFSFLVSPAASVFSYSLSGVYDEHGNRAAVYTSPELRFNATTPTLTITNNTNAFARPGHFNGPFVATLNSGSPILRFEASNVVGSGMALTAVSFGGGTGASFAISPSDPEFSYVVSNVYDVFGNRAPDYFSGKLMHGRGSDLVLGLSNPTNANASPGYFNSPFVATLESSHDLQPVGASNFLGTNAVASGFSGLGASGVAMIVSPLGPAFSYSLNRIYDVYGNQGAVSSPQLFYSVATPSIVITNPTNPNALPGFYNAPFLAVLRSEPPLRSVSSSNFAGTGASSSGFAGSSTLYTFSVSPSSASFSYVLSGLYDVFGNLAPPYASGSMAFNTSAPRMTVSNPTNSKAAPGFYNAPFVAQVTASARLRSVSASNFSGSQAAAITFSGSSPSFTFVVVPGGGAFSYSLSSIYDIFGNQVDAYSSGPLYYSTSPVVATLSIPHQPNALPGFFNSPFVASVVVNSALSSLGSDAEMFSSLAGASVGETTVQGTSSFAFKVFPSSASFSFGVTNVHNVFGNRANALWSPVLYYSAEEPDLAFSLPTNPRAAEDHYNSSFVVSAVSRSTLRGVGASNFAGAGASASAFRSSSGSFSFVVSPSEPTFGFEVFGIYDRHGNLARTFSRSGLRFNRTPPEILGASNPTNPRAASLCFNAAFRATIVTSSALREFAFDGQGASASGFVQREAPPYGLSFDVRPLSETFSYSIKDVYDLYGNRAADYVSETMRFRPPFPAPTFAVNNARAPNSEAGYHRGPFEVVVSGSPDLGSVSEANFRGLGARASGFSERRFLVDPESPSFSYSLVDVCDAFGNVAEGYSYSGLYNSRAPEMLLERSLQPDADAGFYNAPFDVRALLGAPVKMSASNILVSGCSASFFSGSGASYAFKVFPGSPSFSYSVGDVFDLFGNRVDKVRSGELYYNAVAPEVSVSFRTNPRAASGYFNASFDAIVTANDAMRYGSLSYEASNAGVEAGNLTDSSFVVRVTPSSRAFSFGVSGIRDRYGNVAPPFRSGELFYSTSKPTLEVANRGHPRATPGRFRDRFEAEISSTSALMPMTLSNFVGTMASASDLRVGPSSFGFVVSPSSSSFSYRVSGIADLYGNVADDYDSGVLLYNARAPDLAVENKASDRAAPNRFNDVFEAAAFAGAEIRASESNFSGSNCRLVELRSSGHSSFALRVEPLRFAFSYALSGIYDTYGNELTRYESGALEYVRDEPSLEVEFGTNSYALPAHFNAPFLAFVSSPRQIRLSEGVRTYGINADIAEILDLVYEVRPTTSGSFSFGISEAYDVYGNRFAGFDSGDLSYDAEVPGLEVSSEAPELALPGYFNAPFAVRARSDSSLRLLKASASGASTSQITISGSFASFVVFPQAASFSYRIHDVYDAHGNKAADYESGTLLFRDAIPDGELSNPTFVNADSGFFNDAFHAAATFPTEVRIGRIEALGASVHLETGSPAKSFAIRVTPFQASFSYSVAEICDLYGNVAPDLESGPLSFGNEEPTVAAKRTASSHAAPGYYNAPFVLTLESNAALRLVANENLEGSGVSFGKIAGSGNLYAVSATPLASSFSYAIRGLFDRHGNAASDIVSGPLFFDDASLGVEVENAGNANADSGYYNAPFEARLRASKPLRSLSISNFSGFGASLTSISGSDASYVLQVVPNRASFSYSISDLYDMYGNRAPDHASPVMRYDPGGSKTLTVEAATNPRARSGYYNAAFEVRGRAPTEIREMTSDNVTGYGASFSDVRSSGSTFRFFVTPGASEFGFVVSGLYDRYGNEIYAYTSGPLLYRSSSLTPTTATRYVDGSGDAEVSGYYNAPFVVSVTYDTDFASLGPWSVSASNARTTSFTGHDSSLSFVVSPTASVFSYAIEGVHDLYGNEARDVRSNVLYFKSSPTDAFLESQTNPNAEIGYFNAPVAAVARFGAAIQRLEYSNIVAYGASVSGLQGSAGSFAFDVTPLASEFSYAISGLRDVYGNAVREASSGTLRYGTSAPSLIVTNNTNSRALPGFYNSSFVATVTSSTRLRPVSLSNFVGSGASAFSFSNDGSFSYYIVTPNAPSFSYSLTRVRDAYGNVAPTYSTATLTYDTVAPTVVTNSNALGESFLNGMEVWLDAAKMVTADASGNVSKWEDLSAKKRQVFSGTFPRLLSSRMYFNYNNAAHVRIAKGNESYSRMTVVVAGALDSGAVGGRFFQLFGTDGWTYGDVHMHITTNGLTVDLNGAGNDPKTFEYPLDGPFAIIATFDRGASSISLWINGIQIRATNTADETLGILANTSSMWIGNYSTFDRAFNGYVSEFLAFSRVLTATEMALMQQYLTQKYRYFDANVSLLRPSKTNINIVPWRIEFSKGISNFSPSLLSVSSAVPGSATQNASGSSFQFVVNIPAPYVNVRVNVPTNTLVDRAGNPPPFSGASLYFDNVAPYVVSFSGNTGSYVENDNGNIGTYYVYFNKGVSLTYDHIKVSNGYALGLSSFNNSSAWKFSLWSSGVGTTTTVYVRAGAPDSIGNCVEKDSGSLSTTWLYPMSVSTTVTKQYSTSIRVSCSVSNAGGPYSVYMTAYVTDPGTSPYVAHSSTTGEVARSQTSPTYAGVDLTHAYNTFQLPGGGTRVIGGGRYYVVTTIKDSHGRTAGKVDRVRTALTYTHSNYNFYTIATDVAGTVEVTLLGGGGGSSTNASGGRGGYATGTFSMSLSQRIYAYVAEAGGSSTINYYGGGGGGASAIRVGTAFISSSLYLMAGGGGGGGSRLASSQQGGEGGGAVGGDSNGSYAKGGTQTAGGAGSPNGSYLRGGENQYLDARGGWGLGHGGYGGAGNTSSQAGGGGGGGGYYGGGAGTYGQGFGGGGGSGYINGDRVSGRISGYAYDRLGDESLGYGQPKKNGVLFVLLPF